MVVSYSCYCILWLLMVAPVRTTHLFAFPGCVRATTSNNAIPTNVQY